MNKDDEKKILLRVMASVCAFGFLLMLALVVTEHAAGFDDPIRFLFYDLRSKGLTSVLIVITNAANKYFIIAVCLALLIMPRTRLWFGVPLSVGALGTILLNTGIKYLVSRERPDAIRLVTEDGYSFPSGHSIMSVFFYGMALWLIWHYARPSEPGPEPLQTLESSEGSSSRKRPSIETKTAIVLTVLLLIPMVIVGLSRIYLGVHYPSDVLAGWCLGGIAIFIEAQIILALERKRQETSLEDH